MKTPLLSIAICLVAIAHADVNYKLKFQRDPSVMKIEITAIANSDTTVAKIPNWAPGAYILQNFAGGVKEFKVTQPGLDSINVDNPKPNVWSFGTEKGKPFTVTYTVGVGIDSEIIHFSGPSTYLYLEGRKGEKCNLSLEIPSEWASACGLDSAGSVPHSFTAPDYDTLADNPVTAGKFEMDTYLVERKPHYVVYRGKAVEKLDRKKVVSVLQKITETCSKFFGGLPYKKYVWHFNVFDSPDGGGGLEHLSSTQISLSSGFGPRVQSVCAHEFFHLWNVKRVRSFVLGPFQYDELPKTGALWWLEGVTDYYASLLMLRSGLWDDKQFLEDAVRNITTTRNNAERFNVSIFDSSFRVGEANNGRGNSSGFGVNYYNSGWVAGFALDLELRARTNSKHSLDDVEMALWNMCRDGKPGFQETEIRKLLVMYGGEPMGPVYDKWVALPGDVQIEDALAKAGYQIITRTENYLSLGIDYRPDPDRKGVRVTRAFGPSAGKFMANDLITSIGDQSLAGLTPGGLRAVFDGVKADVPVRVMATREGAPDVNLQITPALFTRDVKEIKDVPAISSEQSAVRKAWRNGRGS